MNSRLTKVKRNWRVSEGATCSLSYAQLEVLMNIEVVDEFSYMPCYHKDCKQCPFFKENLKHALDPETMASDILAGAKK